MSVGQIKNSCAKLYSINTVSSYVKKLQLFGVDSCIVEMMPLNSCMVEVMPFWRKRSKFLFCNFSVLISMLTAELPLWRPLGFSGTDE